jgi:hypothetical protein
MTNILSHTAGVEGEVFAAHPEYVALIVFAEGIGNGPSDDDSSAVLDAAEQHLRARRSAPGSAVAQLESLLEARWSRCTTRRIRLDRD